MTSPDKIPATLDAFFQAFWVDEDKAKAGKGEGMMKCFSDVLGEEEAKKVVEMVSAIIHRLCHRSVVIADGVLPLSVEKGIS